MNLIMDTQTYNMSVNFEQILGLIRQLPNHQKLLIGKELEKDLINSKLSYFLNSFQTDELQQDTIDSEVEKVREEIYVRKQKD